MLSKVLVQRIESRRADQFLPHFTDHIAERGRG